MLPFKVPYITPSPKLHISQALHTRLFAAAECGFLDVVKLLLKAEADLSRPDFEEERV